MRFAWLMFLGTVSAFRTCADVRQEYGSCCDDRGCNVDQSLKREYQQHRCCSRTNGGLCFPDYQPPELINVPADIMDCNTTMPTITVEEDCGSYSLTTTVETTVEQNNLFPGYESSMDNMYRSSMLRRWVAKDNVGNMAQATQMVTCIISPSHSLMEEYWRKIMEQEIRENLYYYH